MNIRIVGAILLFILSLGVFAITGDAWNSVLEDAAEASGGSDSFKWFVSNWLAVLFGMGGIFLLVTGVFGGDD